MTNLNGYAGYDQFSGRLTEIGFVPNPGMMEIPAGLAYDLINFKQNIDDYIVRSLNGQLQIEKITNAMYTLLLQFDNTPQILKSIPKHDYNTPIKITCYPCLNKLNIELGWSMHRYLSKLNIAPIEKSIKLSLTSRTQKQTVFINLDTLIKTGKQIIKTKDIKNKLQFCLYADIEASLVYNYSSAEFADYNPADLGHLQHIGSTINPHNILIDQSKNKTLIHFDFTDRKLYRKEMVMVFVTKLNDPWYILERHMLNLEQILDRGDKYKIKSKIKGPFSVFSEPLYA